MAKTTEKKSATPAQPAKTTKSNKPKFEWTPKERNKAINLALIVTVPELEIRVQLDQSTVDDYAEKMLAGKRFPAIPVFWDGTRYLRPGGNHRYAAADKIKAKAIRCDVYEGTLDDALMFGLQDNNHHGLKMSNADKRKSVLIVLNKPEWKGWSNNVISDLCGVSPTYVANLRAELAPPPVTSEPAPQANPDNTAASGGDATAENQPGTAEPAASSGDEGMSQPESASQGETPAPDQILYMRNGQQQTMKKPAPAPAPKPQPVGVLDGAGGISADVPAATPQQAPAATVEPDEDDLTDEDWLKSLPARETLAPYPDALEIFDEDAKAWRTARQSGFLANLKKEGGKVIKQVQGKTPTLGNFAQQLNRLIRFAHPRDWQPCSTCGGSRQVWIKRAGGEYLEPGTVEPNESNQLAIRGTKTACTKCRGGYSTSAAK